MSDDRPVNGISQALGNISGQLAQLDKRMDHQDAVLESVRSHSEQMGLSLAGCQSAAARREKRVSALEKRVRATEDTSVIHVTGQRVRWRTLATLGAVLVSLVSVAATFGLTRCDAKGNNHKHQPAARAVDARR